MIVAAGAIVASVVVAGGVYLTMHRSTTADSSTVASTVPYDTPNYAPPVADTVAASPSGASGSSAAAMTLAGQQYLAQATVVNTAVNTFGATLSADASKPCSCPAGEFSATTAMVQLPGVIAQLQAMGATLQRIKTEVPQFSADIDAVARANQQEIQDFTTAYADFQSNNAQGNSDAVTAFSAVETASAPLFSRLRVDLGLPAHAS